MAEMSSGGRDLVGYGANPPAVPWPNGARLAVSVVVNYEEGSEYSQAMGDATQEGLTEFGNYPLPEGYRNLAMESMFEYGSRAGVWRILRLFDETGIVHLLRLRRGLRAEPGGRPRRRCRRPRGVQPRLSLGGGVPPLTGGGARAHPARGRVLRAHLRQAAGGLVLPLRPLVHTRELVVEEGGFLYDSDAYNDDLPYFVEVGGKRHLIVPYTPDANDFCFWTAPGFITADHFYQYLRDSFDTLYAESATTPEDDVHRAARPHDRPPRPDRRTRPLHRARASARGRLVRDARRNRPPLARSGGVGSLNSCDSVEHQ